MPNSGTASLRPARRPLRSSSELNARIVAALKDPAIRRQITSLDIQVVTDTPDEFARIIAADYKRWGDVIRSTGFTLDE